MPLRKLFNWIFYGHVWIALAAMSLSWLSLRIVFGYQDCIEEWPVLTFVFFATLGIYTLHRLLSFQRAGEQPTTLRYGIVAQYPGRSLFIGGVSMLIAGILCLSFIKAIWPALLLALPITIFYLTPPLKGWRRLRDLPYLKNLWVALAWTIMTVIVPIIVIESQTDIFRPEYGGDDDLMGLINPFSCGISPLNYANFYLEIVIRFILTGCIALLFDLRDLKLDQSQGVRTVAGKLPGLHRILVYSGILVCAFAASIQSYRTCVFPGIETFLFVGYLLMLPVAYLTYKKTAEDWFAVAVNGLLLLPPLACLLGALFGADAGAVVGL